jgi:hypothetical protein
MEAEFTVPGRDGDIAFRGGVDEVRMVPGTDKGAVYYKVILDVRNTRDESTGEWQLRPGLTASVDFVRRAHERAWKVPSSALNFRPGPETLSEAAKARLAGIPDPRWKPVWVVGTDDKPWPVFARTGGVNDRGELAIQDALASEVLEWDATLQPAPDAKNTASYPQLIIAAPSARKSGLFSPPKVKF